MSAAWCEKVASGPRYATLILDSKDLHALSISLKITSIAKEEKGDAKIVIRNASGKETSQTIPAGLTLIVKEGDVVKADQGLNIDPNAGGFGQEESEIVLQNPIRIIGYLAFCFSVVLTQVLIVLKKKQYEKVQAAELNF